MKRKFRCEEEDKQEVICKLGDELFAFEILRRLPIKYLMSFKYVSKHWQSFIQEDQLFLDYLHSRVLNRTSLLLVGNPRYTHDPRCIFTAELLVTNRDECAVSVAAATNQWIAKPSRSEHQVCSLDGLVCFIDTDYYRAYIYNVTTRESTPWIKSVIKKDVDEEQALYKYSSLILLKHEFGYDPVSKEYKVVALWRLRRRNRETNVETVEVVCELLTVRKNSWRKIDVVLPPDKSPHKVITCVYTNGLIYWHCLRYYSDTATASYFVEFDVGNETFRLVSTSPQLNSGRHFYMSNLMELDGRLARLLGSTKCIRRRRGNNNIVRRLQGNTLEMNMCLLHANNENIDEGAQEKIISSGVSNNYWTEEIIPMAVPFEWKSIPERLTLRSVPGTADLFLLSCIEDKEFSLYYYDLKKKSFSKIKINGLESQLTGKNDEIFDYDDFELYTFKPNLSPVN